MSKRLSRTIIFINLLCCVAVSSSMPQFSRIRTMSINVHYLCILCIYNLTCTARIVQCSLTYLNYSNLLQYLCVCLYVCLYELVCLCVKITKNLLE